MTIFRNYDYFLSIVSTGNITRSAANLHISQPSLTQHLHNLEKELGAVLFDRNSSPLRLTPAGEVFYEYVLKCRELDDKLQFNMGVLRSDVSGELTIGVPVQLQPYIMKNILLPFMDEYPDIEVNVNGEHSRDIEKLMQKRMLDIAVIYCIEPVVSSLRYVPLQKDPLVLICSKTKAPAAPEAKPLQFYSDRTFFLADPESTLRAAEEKLFEHCAFRPPKTRVIPGMDAVVNLVAEGKGLAFVPETFYDSHPRRDELSALPLSGEKPYINMVLLTYKSNCPRQVSCIAKYIELHGKAGN